MNQKNLDYLKDGLKYTGFGEQLHAELEKHVQGQAPAFQLHMQVPFHNATMDYALHFRRSDQSAMYFFNKYEATLRPDDSAKAVSQTFYINRNGGITAKEAYNLLSGRAVHKELLNAEGQTYQAWLQLDLKTPDPNGNHQVRQFHENYGFDLEKTLQRFFIKELQDPQQKDQLLQSLRKGNQQLVTALEEGYEVKRYIEASPQFKTINVYNEQRHQAMRETIQRQEPRVGQRIEQAHQAQKQATAAQQTTEQRQDRRKGLAP